MTEMIIDDVYYDWNPSKMLEVTIETPDDFLKIKETLTRIGIPSMEQKTLWQSCFILHKQGRYFIVHFKEMYLLDGQYSSLTVNDVHRRNTVANLLQFWGLLKIVNSENHSKRLPVSSVKIIPYKDKHEWQLSSKYSIGTLKPSKQIVKNLEKSN